MKTTRKVLSMLLALAMTVSILSSMGFGPANALALMTFSLLYTPCAATLATIKKETGSWRWTAVAMLAPTVAGMLLCFLFTAAVGLLKLA